MSTHEQKEMAGDAGRHDNPGGERTELHIFVNRRKFDEDTGVKRTMTGAQLAALVGISADNAVVHQETGAEKGEVGMNQAVQVKNGDHFVATRKVVEGGACA